MKFLSTLLLVAALFVGGLAIWGQTGDGGALNVRVERTIDAPITTVFARLTDHANWKQFPGITGSELIKPSNLPLLPNATGAVRRIDAGPLSFVEEVTGYVPLRSMEYRITESSPIPIAHEYGRITLSPAGLSKTSVVWESKGVVDVPVIGGGIGKIMGPQLEASFVTILESLERPPQG